MEPVANVLNRSLGGLTGARILSLAFMLGATCLLYFAARRLCGRQAAFFAAILFAIAGPTLHLGSFATFDAMSLFLVAFAAWCATSASRRQDATWWILAAAGSLAWSRSSQCVTDPSDGMAFSPKG